MTVTSGGGSTSVITINCPANRTVTAASGASTANVTYTTPTASTTCTQGGTSLSRISGLQTGSAFPVGTSTVVYPATDPCGTSKTCSFTVTVNPSGGGNNCGLNITFTQDMTCNQTQGLLTANVTGNSGGNSFAWSNGQAGQSIYTNPGSYTVTVTTGSGCTQTATGALTAPVNIQSGMNISGRNVTLNPRGGVAPYIAQWTGSGYSNWGPLAVTNLAPGSYTVTVYDANWCSRQFSFTITSNKIAAAAEVALTAEVEAGEVALQWTLQTADQADKIYLERQALDANAAPIADIEIIAQLSDNQYDSNTDTKQIRYYSHTDAAPLEGASRYRVVVERTGSPLHSAWVTVEFDAFERVLLYPNPAVHQVSLAFEKMPVGDFEVRLVDALGRVVVRVDNSLQVDLSDVESGVYFVWVLSAGERKVVRRLDVLRF